MIRTY